MTGWLVINSFAQTDSSREIFRLLAEAAAGRDIELKSLRTVDISFPVNGDVPWGQAESPFHDRSQDSRSDTFCPPLDRPDFVLFWDKDIYLAKRLEAAGLRLFNSAQAIETCDSKALTAIALQGMGVPMPLTFISPKTFEYFGYNNLTFLSEYEKALGYPYVIKEEFGSFGLNVHLINNASEAEDTVKKMGYKTFIAQEFISESSGQDVRCYVVGGRVIASMLRTNENDFRSNIFQGGKGKGYKPSPEEEMLAVKASEAVGCDFCGVDLLVGGGREPLVCEVNSNAHFSELLRCTGVNAAENIMEHIMGQIKTE